MLDFKFNPLPPELIHLEKVYSFAVHCDRL